MIRLMVMTTTLLVAAGCGLDIDDTADVVGATARVEAVGCQPSAQGTAVAVEPGIFLTAAHTVTGADSITLTTDGGTIEAITLVLDTEIDIAVLGAADHEGPYLDLGPERVDGAVAIGVLRDRAMLESTELRRVVWTQSTDVFGAGEVARLAIEVDAEIDPGDSGAAVVNSNGQVVGIVVSDVRDAAITFAVHPHEIRPLIELARDRGSHIAGRCRR